MTSLPGHTLRHLAAVGIALLCAGCGATTEAISQASPALLAPTPTSAPVRATEEPVRPGGPAQLLRPPGDLVAAVWADDAKAALLRGLALAAGGYDDAFDDAAGVFAAAFGEDAGVGEFFDLHERLLAHHREAGAQPDLRPVANTLAGLAPTVVGVPAEQWGLWLDATTDGLDADDPGERFSQWAQAVGSIDGLAVTAARERVGNWPDRVRGPASTSPMRTLRIAVLMAGSADAISDGLVSVATAEAAEIAAVAGDVDVARMTGHLAGWAQAAALGADARSRGDASDMADARQAAATFDGNVLDTLGPAHANLAGFLAERTAAAQGEEVGGLHAALEAL